MNIRIEDDRPLKEREDVVFPLRVVLSCDSGDITLYAMKEFEFAAGKLDGVTADKLFADDTREYVSSMINEAADTYGYDSEVVLCTEYALEKREQVNKSLILDSTEALMSDCGYNNMTECVPDPNNEGLLCFGTVIDGEIVSSAVENPHHPDDNVIDIAVETCEECRGKGYGASNVAALSYYLLDPDIMVTYTTEDTNIQSVRLAEKVGFTKCQRVLVAAMYKK